MRCGEHIDRLLVYRKFNWTCHICGGKINCLLRLPDKMAATIDHIIPLSRGGEHLYSNVAPAHYLCNELKANRLSD